MAQQTQDSASNPMYGQAAGINRNLAQLVAMWARAFPLSAFQGTFTCAAAASTVVSNTNVKVGSTIILQPANAAAGTLQGSAKCLYPNTLVAGASFTVTTASAAAAAGTEIFSYLIINTG